MVTITGRRAARVTLKEQANGKKRKSATEGQGAAVHAEDASGQGQEGLLKRGKAAGLTARGRSKYSAIRTEVDGITFASRKEARRYGELKLLQAAGVIRNLALQVRYPIAINDILVCHYVADFDYSECSSGAWAHFVEDVKGMRTPIYKLKAKLMRACHGIEIRET